MAIDRELALRYLTDCLYGGLLGQAGAVRPSDLVRSLPHGVRVGVALLRQVLEDNERFVEIAGRFDIADREAIGRRPFGGAVLTLLAGYGRPMPLSLLITALSRLRGGSPDYFRELLGNWKAATGEIVFSREYVLSSEWVLVLEDEDEERVLFHNFLEDDEKLRELWEACEKRDLRKRDPGLTAANILEAFDCPIGPRQLAFLTWLHHPQIFDPVEFVGQVLDRDDVVPVAGRWVGQQQFEELLEELRKASDEVVGEGEQVPAVDLEEVLAAEPPSTPYAVDEGDRANVLSIASQTQTPIGIDELVIDLLDITPDQRKFVAAAQALQEALHGEADLMEVSPGRYLSRQAVPDWVHEIPEPLIPVQTEDERDVLLHLEALPDQLRDEVLDPLFEDIACGVEIAPEEDYLATDSTDYPLLHHHYIMGTMAIRAIDRELFATEAPLTLVLMRYEDRDVYPAWLNQELGLLFGLSRWYQRHLPQSGGIFRIVRTEEPDCYLVEYDGDTEDDLAPDDERMARLEHRRERVSHRPISIFDLMVDLMQDHEAGLSFNALWAEMNVVRRTSRWQIASLLALYPCFEEQDGTWTVESDLVREPGRERLEEFVIRPEEGEDEAEPDEEAEERDEDVEEDADED